MNGARLAGRIAAGGVRLYQVAISGLKPPCCRFYPSCSEYSRQALLRFGIWRGTWLAVRRVLRCQPLYRGPLVDPVPGEPVATAKELGTQ